ncbi:MAG: DUF1643 domain-containing protein [Nitrosomonas sp.]|uniref:DUF1643 domain-containing protein n=1 Tax=Nitrosomonas sp. TaxID=42353 RepID=UPI0025F45FA6|nr:DUF1643 domain-containing protein [Nitrosomonas sp.]MBY0473943.1 DUF1643 domain-containing protein [Nitrosomonas sp.]
MIYKHIDKVRALATFSDCTKYRYRLDISLNEATDRDTKIVCAVMQNPSVANSEIADKSVQFLEKLIFTKGIPQFSGVKKLIVVNQFAFVQTKDFSGQDEHIGSENNSHIQQAISESDIILVAWGSGNAYETRRVAINQMLKAQSGKSLLYGKCHPSRASYVEYVSEYSI